MSRPTAARRGMTLTEVMIAITILLVMTAVIGETLSNSIEFNRLLSQRDETTRGARVALSTLRRVIQLAYLTPNKLGIDRYETVFVGVDDDPDQLFLTTLAHQRRYMDTRECDQAEITIFSDDVPKEIEDGHGYVLYFRESGLVDEEPSEDGKVMPLAYNVRSLNLRYLDQANGEWQDTWDTRSAETPYRLPRAVEVALVMIAPDPDDSESTVDVPFLSTIALHYADGMINGQVLAAQQLIASANAANATASQNPFGTGPCGTGANGLCWGGPLGNRNLGATGATRPPTQAGGFSSGANPTGFTGMKPGANAPPPPPMVRR